MAPAFVHGQKVRFFGRGEFAARGEVAGFFDGGFEVVEDFPFGFYLVVAGEAQEVGGVVGGDGGDAVFCVEPAAAVAGDAGVGAHEVFEGDAAEGDDDFGPDKAEFLVKPVEGAEAAFFDGGGAVAFGAAFNDVDGMLVICRRVESLWISRSAGVNDGRLGNSPTQGFFAVRDRTKVGPRTLFGRNMYHIRYIFTNISAKMLPVWYNKDA